MPKPIMASSAMYVAVEVSKTGAYSMRNPLCEYLAAITAERNYIGLINFHLYNVKTLCKAI